MNKKEKFYKNLSEFNIQKVELKDVKTLEALTKEGERLLSSHQSSMKTYQKSEDEYNAWQKQEKFTEENAERMKKSIKEQEISNQKQLDERHKNYQIAYKSFTKVSEKLDIALKKMNGDEEKVIIIQNKIKGMADKIASNLQMFKDGAKNIGIDVSGKVSKYKSIIKKLVEKENIL